MLMLKNLLKVLIYIFVTLLIGYFIFIGKQVGI